MKWCPPWAAVALYGACVVLGVWSWLVDVGAFPARPLELSAVVFWIALIVWGVVGSFVDAAQKRKG